MKWFINKFYPESIGDIVIMVMGFLLAVGILGLFVLICNLIT